MGNPRTILCLAASWKLHGTCIAGKEYLNGKFGDWIRPISNRPDEEISPEERKKNNGFPTNVLDVVTVDLNQAKPHLHQTENHLIEDGTVWRHRRMLSYGAIKGAIDHNFNTLWRNGFSSGKGENDRVPSRLLAQEVSSLALIEPENFELHAIDEVQNGNTSRKYRGSFSFKGIDYNLSVTDPWVSKKWKDKDAGDYTFEDTIICVSLGEEFSGYSYKLIASVIRSGRRG
jgi:hypothetical protein